MVTHTYIHKQLYVYDYNIIYENCIARATVASYTIISSYKPRCKTFSPPVLKVRRKAFFALRSGELGRARGFPFFFFSAGEFIAESLAHGTVNKSCALWD